MPLLVYAVRRETQVQRLFTAFPGGAPGAGLLLLRGATGISAIADAGWIASSGVMPGVWAAVLALCGVLLLVGLVTPVAGVSLAVVQGALVVGAAPLAESLGRRGTLLVAVALALAFLGPGWLSVDAWVFGRRRIVIPDAPRR